MVFKKLHLKLYNIIEIKLKNFKPILSILDKIHYKDNFKLNMDISELKDGAVIKGKIVLVWLLTTNNSSKTTHFCNTVQTL